MKNIQKQICLLLFAAIVILPITGCGESSSPRSDSPTQAQDNTTEADGTDGTLSEAEGAAGDADDMTAEEEAHVLDYQVDGSDTIYYNYTDDGRIQSSYTVDSEGYLDHPKVWTYDDDGNASSIIMYQVFQFDSTSRNVTLGNKVDSIEYEYDSSNNIVKTKEYDGRSNTTTETEYDSDGRKTHTAKQLHNYNSTEDTTYYYDEHGNVIKEEYVQYLNDEKNQELTTEYKYKYDEHGNITEYTETNDFGKMGGGSYTYEYNGDQISKRTDQSGAYALYYYDDRGELVHQEDYTSMGQLEDETLYEYTDGGQLLHTRIDRIDSYYEPLSYVRAREDIHILVN